MGRDIRGVVPPQSNSPHELGSEPEGSSASPRPGEPYRVQKDDTLYVVLQRAGFPKEELLRVADETAQRNANIPHRDLIFENTTIQIPTFEDVGLAPPNQPTARGTTTEQVETSEAPTSRDTYGGFVLAEQPQSQSTRRATLREPPGRRITETGLPTVTTSTLPDAPTAVRGVPRTHRRSLDTLGRQVHTRAADSLANPSRIEANLRVMAQGLSRDATPEDVRRAATAHTEVTQAIGSAGWLGEDTLEHLRSLREGIYDAARSRARLDVRARRAGKRVLSLSAEPREGAASPEQTALAAELRTMTLETERARAYRAWQGKPALQLAMWGVWDDMSTRIFERALPRLEAPDGDLTDEDLRVADRFLSTVETVVANTDRTPAQVAADLKALGDSLNDADTGFWSRVAANLTGGSPGNLGTGADGETLRSVGENVAHLITHVRQQVEATGAPERDSAAQSIVDGLLELEDATKDLAEDDPIRELVVELRDEHLGPDSDLNPAKLAQTILDYDLGTEVGDAINDLRTSLGEDLVIDSANIAEPRDAGLQAADVLLTIMNESLDLNPTNLNADVGDSLDSYRETIEGTREFFELFTQLSEVTLPQPVTYDRNGTQIIIPAGTVLGSGPDGLTFDLPGLFVQTGETTVQLTAPQGQSSMRLLIGADEQSMRFGRVDVTNDSLSGFASGVTFLSDTPAELVTISADAAEFDWDTGSLSLTGGHLTHDGIANTLSLGADSLSYTGEDFDLQTGGFRLAQEGLGEDLRSVGNAQRVRYNSDDFNIRIASLDLNLGENDGTLIGRGINYDDGDLQLQADSAAIAFVTNADGSSSLNLTSDRLRFGSEDVQFEALGSLDAEIQYDSNGNASFVNITGDGVDVVSEDSRVTLSEGAGFVIVRAPDGSGSTTFNAGRADLQFQDYGGSLTDGTVAFTYDAEGNINQVTALSESATITSNSGDDVNLTQGVSIDLTRLESGGEQLTAQVGQADITLADGSTIQVVEGAVDIERNAAGEIVRLVAQGDSAIIDGDFGRVEITEGLSLSMVQTGDGGQLLTGGLGNGVFEMEDGTQATLQGGSVAILQGPDGRVQQIFAGVNRATVTGEFGEAIIENGASITYETFNGNEGLRVLAQVGFAQLTTTDGDKIWAEGAQGTIELDGDNALIAAQIARGGYEGEFGKLDLEGINLSAQSDETGIRRLIFQGSQAHFTGTGEFGNTAGLTVEDMELVLDKEVDGSTILTFGAAADGTVDVNGSTIAIDGLGDGKRFTGNIATNAEGVVTQMNFDFPGAMRFENREDGIRVMAEEVSADYDANRSRFAVSFGALGAAIESEGIEARFTDGQLVAQEGGMLLHIGEAEVLQQVSDDLEQATGRRFKVTGLDVAIDTSQEGRVTAAASLEELLVESDGFYVWARTELGTPVRLFVELTEDGMAAIAQAENLTIDARLEDTEVRVESGKAEIALDPIEGLIIQDIQSTVVDIKTPDAELHIDVERMKGFLLEAGKIESGNIEGFALRLVPTGPDSTLSLIASGQVNGTQIEATFEDVRDLNAFAVYGENYAQLYAGDETGNGKIHVSVGPVELEGNKIDIRAYYRGLDTPFASQRLFRALRRYSTRDTVIQSGIASFEQDGVVRLGGNAGPVRAELSILLRRTPGSNPIFMAQQPPDGLRDAAPSVMLSVGGGSERKYIGVFGGVTDAAYAAVEQVKGNAYLHGTALPKYVGVPMAATYGVEAELGNWRAMVGRYEAIPSLAGVSEDLIRDTNPGGTFLTLDYTTDKNLRASLEAAVNDDGDVDAARLSLAIPLGGGEVADERLRSVQDAFARQEGLDVPVHQVRDETFRPDLQGRIHMGASLDSESALDAAPVHPILTVDNDRVLRSLSALDGEARAEALGALHRGGRFDSLARRLNRTDREALARLIGADTTLDAAVTTGFTRAIVARGKTDAVTALTEAVSRGPQARRMLVSSAVVAATPRSSRNRHNNDSGTRRTRYEQYKAARALTNRIARVIPGGDLAQAYDTAESLGIEGPIFDGIHRERSSTLVAIALDDAQRHIAGQSDGRVLRSAMERLHQEGPDEAFSQLIWVLEPEALAFHMSYLGAEVANEIRDDLEDGDYGDDYFIDRRHLARLLLRPSLRNEERGRLAAKFGLSGGFVSANTDRSLVTVEAFTQEVLDTVSEIETGPDGVRVQVAVPPEALTDPDIRDALRIALDRAPKAGAAEVELVLRGEDVLVRRWRPAVEVQSTEEVSARTYWLEHRIRHRGIDISVPAKPSEIYAEPNRAQGYAELLDYVDRYHNVLGALRVSEIRFGSKTKLRDVETAMWVETPDGNADVYARVLELDTEDLLDELGNPSERIESAADLSTYLGGKTSDARWVLSPHAGVMAGDTDLGLAVLYQPGGNSPVLHGGFSTVTGLGVGARHKLALGDKTVLMGSAGVGIDPENEQFGPRVGGRISRLLYGDPAGKTFVAVSGSAYFDGWNTNVGVILYGEHNFGDHEVHAFVRATLLDVLQGGPHARVQLELFKSWAVNPGVGVGNRLGPYAMVDFFDTVNVKAGLGGAAVGLTDRFEVGVRFLPIPLPYFMFHPALIKYHFSYDPYSGQANVNELDPDHPTGLANIPPPVLNYLFERMMAQKGIDARNSETHAWLEAHGMKEQFAQIQATALNHPDPATRAAAAQAEAGIMRTIGTDLMIREYLGFTDPIDEVTDRDVDRYIERNDESLTRIKTDVLAFGTEEEARAAAERIAADPGTFDQELSTQRSADAEPPSLSAGLLADAEQLDAGDISDVVRLPDGRFGIIRSGGTETVPIAQLPASARERRRTEIREHIRLSRERDAFNEHFNQFVRKHTQDIEAGLRMYRGVLLSQNEDADATAVARAMDPWAIPASAPVAQSKSQLRARVESTQQGLLRARAQLVELRTASESILAPAATPELLRTASKLRSEINDVVSELDKTHRRYERLLQEVEGASDMGDLRDVEEDRRDINARLQRIIDEVSVGGTELEEHLFELHDAHPQIAAPVVSRLGALKLSPTLLALSTHIPPERATDPASRALLQAFQR